MKTIYKYIVPLEGGYHQIPVEAKLLLVGNQDGNITLWFEVHRKNRNESRRIEVRGTGHMVEDNLIHLGSVIMPPFVWHVYETK